MTVYDHIIIGMGMSALGVIKGLSSADCKILVLDNYDNKPEFADYCDEKIAIGRLGKGGASSLWHGVISNLSNYRELENYNDDFKDNFDELYHTNDHSLFEKGYSFIPFKPLRPFSVIQSKFSQKVDIVYDKVVEYHIDVSGKVEVRGEKQKFYSNYLWICAGMVGTISLVSKSTCQFGKFTNDDHMVGYFGQIRRTDLSSDFIVKNQYTFSGHFKKFHKIKLSNNISLYVNLRPAHFEFKDIRKAASKRSFFGEESGRVIHKLINSKSPGLILEALYNKFGFSIKSKVYNITGHIEILGAMEIEVSNTYCKSKYLKSEIELSEEDIKLIKEYFKTDVFIPLKIPLSPGIHYLNSNYHFDDTIDANLCNEFTGRKIIICGGAGLKYSSPEHPTFSYYSMSFRKAQSFNKFQKGRI